MSDPVARGGQLPLALRFPADQRLQTWVGEDAGPVAMLQAFAHGRGDPAIYLQGPAGSGKSHLALAVCAAADDASRDAAYLPLERFATRIADALAIGPIALVAVDGLQHLAGEHEAEVALFALHNRVRDHGGQLLYTADAAPDALPLQLPDLRSRLAQCTRIRLEAPNDDVRRRVLASRASRRGLQLDATAIDWLLRRTGRDLAGLTALLDRLDAASLAAQRRLTVPFLRQVLGDQAD